MARERAIMRNAHTPEAHCVARREAMGIVTDADADGDAQAAALPGEMIE
jgi:hypothetical protein